MTSYEKKQKVYEYEKKQEAQIFQKSVKLCVAQLLQVASVPKHIAFIMDGNRRYARETMNKKTTEGYKMGSEAIFKLIMWMLSFNLDEISLFAFSVENFKRPSEEVDFLMKSMENFICQFTDYDEKYPDSALNTIKLRFYGKTELLPESVQKVILNYNLKKKNMKPKKFINICAPYTSRFEITHAVDILSEYAIKNNLRPEDITDKMIEDTFYTSLGNPPEMLVRTSGEIRFSDFMMPQLSFCYLRFIEKMWPEMTGFDLVKYIAFYQYNLWYNKLSRFYNNLIDSYQAEPKIKSLCMEKMEDIHLIQKPVPAYE